MSRYTGPAWKVSRRLGFSTLESGRELAKRAYAPGQHGPDRRKKLTEYGRQLQEKQKVRVMYGINERQFQRLYIIAKSSNNVTGTEFLQILEARLDNVVYRMGLARTRRAARQLVNHGHVTVNGEKATIPSMIVATGSKISLRDSSKELACVKDAIAVTTSIPAYVTFDKDKLEGVYTRRPERNELNQEIEESLIVEFYNKKL